ncbi:MAG: hypothetical protein EXS05_23970 [Planctomycetaceae bacterium]|nr:hypothetical protein [Planctomycetaceae bacterium]
MLDRLPSIVALCCCLLSIGTSFTQAADDSLIPDRRAKVTQAVEAGLAVIQRGARNYPTHRKCFTCHHQTLPLLGMTAAHDSGLKIDDDLPTEILKFTDASFRGKLDELKQGEGIGGRGLTVGYALWAFELGDRKRDELTEAMVEYLLKLQEPAGHWELHGIRPPAEESLVMCTVLAASGIKSFATETQRGSADAALDKARTWLAAAKLEFHEDRVGRLWGLSRLGGGTDEQFVAARKGLLETQRPDGGWSQLPEMESDPYATGSALYALLATRSTPPPDNDGLAASACLRAADYLLKSQLPDGSWHVVTRATPVQVYFDNGDPHGKDQFLSIAATSWCTAALSRMLPRPDVP